MVRKTVSLVVMSVLITGVIAGYSYAQNKVVVIPLLGSSKTKVVGDAGTKDVLAGKTFSGDVGVGVDGTMVDNGAVTITPSTVRNVAKITSSTSLKKLTLFTSFC